jgi:cobalt-zinc-cadmium efflux system outer membrane protein
MRRIICLLLFTVSLSGTQLTGQTAVSNSSAHPSGDSLFEVVLEHNPTLAAAMQMMEASKLRAGTGNTPPDPMVEMGWLSGFPEAIGNRLDFSVSQEFEFPTTYFRLADAREIRQEQAVLIYDMTRQRILTEARKLMIERIHLNRLRHLLSRRMEQAGQLKEHYRTMLEAGEIGKLSLSQVNLQLSVLKADLEQVQSEIRLNSGRIREITGGEGFSITAEQFPLYEIPERGALDQAYAASPEATLYEREITLKKKQKQVAVSKALPDLTAGYYSETLISERFRGISLGISVPLWSNKNKVKYAKAEISVAEAEDARFRMEQQTALERNLEGRNSLLVRIDELKQVLSEVDNEELLGLALEFGEISLAEYIYSTEYYLQNVRRLMEYERDLRLAEAEIMRVFL